MAATQSSKSIYAVVTESRVKLLDLATRKIFRILMTERDCDTLVPGQEASFTLKLNIQVDDKSHVTVTGVVA